jgi:acyl-CoA hydrolase
MPFIFHSRDAAMSGQQSEVTFRFLAEPTDVNFGGKVHGGMVMKWIDQTGYAGAVGWSGAYCVTAAVGGIQFLEPILIGDLVSVHAKLIHTGTSSMHFSVDVRAHDLTRCSVHDFGREPRTTPLGMPGRGPCNAALAFVDAISQNTRPAHAEPVMVRVRGREHAAGML